MIAVAVAAVVFVADSWSACVEIMIGLGSRTALASVLESVLERRLTVHVCQVEVR